MWPTRISEFRQDIGQDFQEQALLLVHRDNTIQSAAIPTQSFDDIQFIEPLNDTSCDHLQPIAEWELYKWYAADDYVVYDGDAYKCTYYHYSQPGWEPDQPSMWAVWQNLGTCN